MEYMLIDNFNGNINIVYQEDGSGDPLIFDSLEEAQEALEEYCQNGIIVPLTSDELLYTKEQVLNLIHAIDVGINPKTYESSKNLDTEDYSDLAVCKASELNLLKEFEEMKKELKIKD